MTGQKGKSQDGMTDLDLFLESFGRDRETKRISVRLGRETKTTREWT